jgi:hypothetical protein
MTTWAAIDFAGFATPLWCMQLHKLTRKPRRELMQGLAALAPLIRHLVAVRRNGAPHAGIVAASVGAVYPPGLRYE